MNKELLKLLTSRLRPNGMRKLEKDARLRFSKVIGEFRGRSDKGTDAIRNRREKKLTSELAFRSTKV